MCIASDFPARGPRAGKSDAIHMTWYNHATACSLHRPSIYTVNQLPYIMASSDAVLPIIGLPHVGNFFFF